MLSDTLPRADAILCRDCLVHLSFANIGRALERLKASRSRLFIATTFTDHESNENVAYGDWWMLNLQRIPFNFPAPIAIFVEGLSEANGGYSDKSLGVWQIKNL